MGVNLANLKQRHQEYNRKSDLWNFKNGDNVVYIHPPCRSDDTDPTTSGVNFLRCRVHYGVGPNNNMVVCLDQKRNSLLNHPFMKEYLAKRGIELTGECPVCKEIESDTIDPDLSHNMRPQYKYAWGVTPIKHRESPTDEFQNVERKPSVVLVGKMIYEGLIELFYDNGDITDPEHTMFAKVRKTGKGAFGTKYKVDADIDTLKKPVKLPEQFVQKLNEAMTDSCDLFRVLSDMVRGPKEVAALFTGVQLADEDGDDLDNVDDGWGEPAAKTETEQLDDVFGGPKTEVKPAASDDDALAMLDQEIANLTG